MKLFITGIGTHVGKIITSAEVVEALEAEISDCVELLSTFVFKIK